MCGLTDGNRGSWLGSDRLFENFVLVFVCLVSLCCLVVEAKGEQKVRVHLIR